MTLMIDLPPEVENSLRAQSADFEAEGKEAMLVELYRQDKLSHHELALSLGMTRFEVDGLLKKHNVTEDLPTVQEMAEDLEKLRKLVQS